MLAQANMGDLRARLTYLCLPHSCDSPPPFIFAPSATLFTCFLYLRFCRRHIVNPLKPCVYDLLSFLLFLQTILKSPGAVRNYFSSMKLWIYSSPGHHSAVDAYELVVMKHDITKLLLHIHKQAFPLSTSQFKQIISVLYTCKPRPVDYIIALVIAYITVLSQSNLVLTQSPSPHVLKFVHVMATPVGLNVLVASSNGRPKSACPILYKLPRIHNSPCCPLRTFLTPLA